MSHSSAWPWRAALVDLDPVAQIALPAAVLIALVVYEISAYRDARLEIRTSMS